MTAAPPPGSVQVAAAAPATVPGPVRAMLDAAIASGNEGEVATVAKYARDAVPNAAEAIEALVDGWRKDRATELAAQAAGRPSTAPVWKGRTELGGYVTSGNTNDAGLNAAIELYRETARWRHKLKLAADYQQSAGATSREHYLASYEPNFKFSPRGYVYGAGQYESDRFLGYFNRYSASIGAGFSAIKQPGLTLDLELGPAYRDTDFTDETQESSLAVRGSLGFGWKLTRAISFSQNTSAYVEHYNSTVSSTTAVDAKLIGPLSAKLSYALQYESMPPIGRVGTDTTSRAALVYSF